jgi:hypothetical protein
MEVCSRFGIPNPKGQSDHRLTSRCPYRPAARNIEQVVFAETPPDIGGAVPERDRQSGKESKSENYDPTTHRFLMKTAWFARPWPDTLVGRTWTRSRFNMNRASVNLLRL